MHVHPSLCYCYTTDERHSATSESPLVDTVLYNDYIAEYFPCTALLVSCPIGDCTWLYVPQA